MSSLQIHQLPLWQNHEVRALEVLLLGLEILVSSEGIDRLKQEQENNEDNWEDKVNRVLSFCLNKANRRLSKQGRGISMVFLYECRNQPDPDATTRNSSEYKRCDFKAGYIDDQEDDEFQGSRFLDVECKRLGEPTISKWMLNNQYVENGIRRFQCTTHMYGSGVPSGGMVGYIESLDHNQILNEINLHAGVYGIPSLNLNGVTWVINGVSQLSHTIERPFLISPFTLNHFWIDVRNHFSFFKKSKTHKIKRGTKKTTKNVVA